MSVKDKDNNTETKVYYTTEQLLQAIEDYEENRMTRRQVLEMITNLTKNEGSGGRLYPFIKAINLITDSKERDIAERKKKLKEAGRYSKSDCKVETESVVFKKISSVFGFGKKIFKEVAKAAKNRR